MLATMPNGDILWANAAFENLLGYTSVELVGKKTWVELTKSGEDLLYDQQNVSELLSGNRTSYQLQKHYITKGGTFLPVVIDVLRYPVAGEFECFLVAVVPVDRGLELALSQVVEIRSLLVEMTEKAPSGLTVDKAISFAKEHPVAATVIGTLFGVLLFGERVIEILKLFGVKVGSE